MSGYRGRSVQEWPNRAVRDVPSEWQHDIAMWSHLARDWPWFWRVNQTPASRGEVRRNWPSWFAPDVRRFWRSNRVSFQRGRFA